MTVKLLATYGKQPAGSLFTGDATTETALVSAGLATSTLTGGTAWPPAVDAGAGSAWPGLTATQIAATQALVSGAGILWANRPAAASVPGQTVRFTDVGSSAAGSHWVSDGTNWRPVGGRVLLASQSGSVAVPVSSVTGTTGSMFTLPGGNVKVPAGMIVPGAASFVIKPTVRRIGANATGNFNIAIGTTQSAADSNLLAIGMAATTNLDYAPDCRIFVSTTGVITSTAYLQTGGAFTGGSTIDRSANFNTGSDMWVTFYTSSANAADAFQILGFTVELLQ